MSDAPTIRAQVRFREVSNAGRQQPRIDCTNYRPHVVVGERNQTEPLRASDGRTLIEDYLSVVFTGNGQVMDFDKDWIVELRLWNDSADYFGLIPDATFTIREGGYIVGSGIVLDPT